MDIKRLTFIFILFLIIIPFFSSELVSPEGELSGDLGCVEKIQDGSLQEEIESINSTSQIKDKLLTNPVVIKIDETLKKVNIVFQILFGVDYSFSLFFLLAFSIWLFFVHGFDSVFYGYSSFSPLVSFSIACLLVIISAQFGIIKFLAEKSNNLIWWFYKLFKGEQPLLIEILAIIVFFALIIFLAVLIKKFGKITRINREKNKEKEDREKLSQDRKLADAFVKPIEKSLKETE
jgi:hypothetical protein